MNVNCFCCFCRTLTETAVVIASSNLTYGLWPKATDSLFGITAEIRHSVKLENADQGR